MSHVTPAVADRFEQALSLVAAGLHSRAGELLAECVRQAPDHPEFVDAIINHLKHLPKPDAGDTSSDASAAELARARDEKNWPEVERLALRRLAAQRDLAALLGLADAASARRSTDIEQRYVAGAFALFPNAAEAVRRQAAEMSRLGRFDDAIALWERVDELEAGDTQATQMVARAIIDRSRVRAGLATNLAEPQSIDASQPADEATSSQALDRGEKEWKLHLDLPHLTAELKRTPIQQLELAVREFPAHGEYYLQLASIYLSKGRDYDAERLLAKGLEEASDDPRVREMWEDVAMLRHEARVAAAQQQAEADGTPASRAALADARNKRDRQEIEIYNQRCKRDPGNARLQFQLGIRLRKAGKYAEAIKRFEAALADANERPAAAFELGECFQQAGQLAEALRAYRQAIDSAVTPTQNVWRKRALYQAAELATRAKLLRRARRYVSDLLRIDAHDRRAASMLADLERQKA